MTPSKFLNSESASKSPNTAGMFRAQNDSANPDSKNKFNINMINSNFKNSNMIMEKSIFEEENQDVNNFFQFISLFIFNFTSYVKYHIQILLFKL